MTGSEIYGDDRGKSLGCSTNDKRPSPAIIV